MSKDRPTVIACAVFGGRSPITGKLVGTYHRWSNGDRPKFGNWGKGRCDFCGRTLDQVLTNPKDAK